MAEGTYEYECARAELLGMREPSIDEFNAAQEARQLDVTQTEQQHDDDSNDVNVGEDGAGEQAGNQSKYEKFNGILSITQQRINKFKVACGSLTNLLKLVPVKESSSGESNENVSDGGGGGGIDEALDTLDQIKDVEQRS